MEEAGGEAVAEDEAVEIKAGEGGVAEKCAEAEDVAEIPAEAVVVAKAGGVAGADVDAERTATLPAPQKNFLTKILTTIGKKHQRNNKKRLSMRSWTIIGSKQKINELGTIKSKRTDLNSLIILDFHHKVNFRLNFLDFCTALFHISNSYTVVISIVFRFSLQE